MNTPSIGISLGAQLRIAFLVARIRRKVQHSHARVSIRVGVMLLLFSIVHIAILGWEIFSGRIRLASNKDFNQYVISESTWSLSVASIVMHVTVALPHGELRRTRLTTITHIIVHAMDPVFKFCNCVLQTNLVKALYYAAYMFIFFPLLTRTLWKLLCQMRGFSRQQRNHVVRCRRCVMLCSITVQILLLVL